MINLLLFLFSISMLNIQTVKEKCTIDTIKREIKIISVVLIVLSIVIIASLHYIFYIDYKHDLQYTLLDFETLTEMVEREKKEFENKRLQILCIICFFIISVSYSTCIILKAFKLLKDEKKLNKFVELANQDLS